MGGKLSCRFQPGIFGASPFHTDYYFIILTALLWNAGLGKYEDAPKHKYTSYVLISELKQGFICSLSGQAEYTPIQNVTKNEQLQTCAYLPTKMSTKMQDTDLILKMGTGSSTTHYLMVPAHASTNN